MKRLADRFVLERELGSGGMACVFLGRDEVLDRPVAVKVLKPLHGDTEIGARFRREGRTAARLSHPNIVQVYDAGEAELDGREASYIVMEYLSGGDLKGRIDGRGQLAGPELARIGQEVCSGLAHAHGRGIIHRDIKPHNILLDDHGRAKVSDFGIARALDMTQATRSGVYLGTALYSSPEQLQGHEITPKTDVYALGVTMYQAATGEPLFTGTPIEIASQHVTKPPPPLRERAPELELGGDLEALILACLAKDAADRPSAEQASSRFRGATAIPKPVQKEESPAPPPRREGPRPAPTVASSGGRVRHRRFPGALAAVAVLAVLLVVGLLALPGLFSGPNNTPQNNQANVGGGSNGEDGGGSNEEGNGPDQAAAGQTTPAASDQASASSGPSGSDGAPAQERGGSGGETQDDSPEKAAAQVVRDFYETAASSDYRSSWDYLTSGYQQDIGSRGALTNQFRTLERVEFTENPTTTQLNGNTATVSASTIAHHSDRDEALTGTANLVRTGGEWRISSLNFNPA